MLYRCDGTTEYLTPANGVCWSLAELQALVGGYIEVVRTRAGQWLVINEEGLLHNLKPNHAATELYVHGGYHIVRGDALWIDTILELNGPDEPEE